MHVTKCLALYNNASTINSVNLEWTNQMHTKSLRQQARTNNHNPNHIYHRKYLWIYWPISFLSVLLQNIIHPPPPKTLNSHTHRLNADGMINLRKQSHLNQHINKDWCTVLTSHRRTIRLLLWFAAKRSITAFMSNSLVPLELIARTYELIVFHQIDSTLRNC